MSSPSWKTTATTAACASPTPPSAPAEIPVDGGTRRREGKFSCYQAEKQHLQRIADDWDCRNWHRANGRHPLSYLMEAADDICYAVLDPEDGIEIGLLKYLQVEPIFLPWRAIRHCCAKNWRKRQRCGARFRYCAARRSRKPSTR